MTTPWLIADTLTSARTVRPGGRKAADPARGSGRHENAPQRGTGAHDADEFNDEIAF